MPISLSQARAEFTQRLVAVLREEPQTTNFLRAFFRNETSTTRFVSIEAERGFEYIAEDVVRGTEGNRNTFSQSTEKIFDPPIYREYFDATSLRLYDVVLGALRSDNAQIFMSLMDDVASKLRSLRNKIERAKEKQCADILMDGILNLKHGGQINYYRKSASLVDPGAGNYFADNIDPFAQLAAGCYFMRTAGKAQGGVFNAILGTESLADLLNNTKFKERQDLVNMKLDAVTGPVRDNNTGSAFHGQVTAESYKVNLWTYPQYYQNSSKVYVPYIDSKKVVMLPESPNFVMAHAAVPQLIDNPGQVPQQGEYVYGEFPDYRKNTHEYDVQSAPLAIPVAVDQIYTFRAKAA